MKKSSAYLAIAFGLFLAIGEAVRNWGDWQYWPFWLVDYIAAVLLVAGAIWTLRERKGASSLLAGAWGFTSAMFYMSFWSHIASLDQPVDGNIEQTPLTIIIGILWSITIVGFVLSLVAARRED